MAIKQGRYRDFYGAFRWSQLGSDVVEGIFMTAVIVTLLNISWFCGQLGWEVYEQRHAAPVAACCSCDDCVDCEDCGDCLPK